MKTAQSIFPVITGADWARSIKQARTERNLLREKIQEVSAGVQRSREAKK